MTFTSILFEQTTAVTDFILVVMNTLLALMLFKAGHQVDKNRARIWVAVLLCLAFASLLGGISHGYVTSEKMNAMLWHPLNLALAITNGLVILGATYDFKGAACLHIVVPIVLVLSLLFFVLTVYFPDTFIVFVVYQLLTMLFALVIYGTLAYRQQLPGAGLIVAGILISIVAGLVQTQKTLDIQIIWQFNNNGIYHIIQMFSVFVWVLGLRKAFITKTFSVKSLLQSS